MNPTAEQRRQAILAEQYATPPIDLGDKAREQHRLLHELLRLVADTVLEAERERRK